MNYAIRFVSFLFVSLTAYSGYAAIKVANVLQSNMVVQQGKPFKLWGAATAGEMVKITADWASAVTVKAGTDGNWITQVSVPKAKTGDFTAHVITVDNGKETLKFTNILIGDVWFCVGQSNMDMPVTEAMFLTYPGVLNYKEEIAAANFPAIRMYKAQAEFKVAPQGDTKGNWQVCSPQTVGNFSGVAYFFGRQLFLKLNIPIGLVVSAAPGASTQAFTKREVLESDPTLKSVYLTPQLDNISIQKKVDTTGFFSNVTKPTLLYNGNIYPFLNLSVKGIIYYQGESNARSDKRDEYILLFTKMVADWRKDFKQGDLPFYYTQIAPFREAGEDSTDYKAAIFRETQGLLSKIKNTAMAVTLDVGEKKTVHPSDKRSVGERLARIALNKTYGQKNITFRGPRFSAYHVNGNTITIDFDKTSALTTKDGKAPVGFMVAGEDKVFHPAEAKITGNTVILSNFNVAKPVAVRYAFTNWVGTNLQNTDGLPAMQFRTDNWDK
ncbi:sialate O-acetylesterase [Mucilaginibacter limnophilus]|uniref:Sialate O-acetylesterase n=1 Tax=Mucilaginibacter limnophilus TaxID=1932778 RepID=A0A3S2V9K3_9SPHI|nr:sialate O-acetylesterase [Mucilaginibacter limnophilus]RVU02039.1 sialate O-acetylesterase [Mucilaginibacter limnophilus]